MFVVGEMGLLGKNEQGQNSNLRNRNAKEASKAKSLGNYDEKQSKEIKNFNDIVKDLQPDKSSYHLTRIILVRFLSFVYG